MFSVALTLPKPATPEPLMHGCSIPFILVGPGVINYCGPPLSKPVVPVPTKPAPLEPVDACLPTFRHNTEE